MDGWGGCLSLRSGPRARRGYSSTSRSSAWTPSGSDTNVASGLTQKEVDSLRQLLEKECGVVWSNAEAWQRARELLAFAKIPLRALPSQSEDEAHDGRGH
jgi:hypothetical protein